MTVASFIIVCNLQQKVIEDNRERAHNRRAGRRWTSHTAGILFYAFFHDTKVNKKVFFFCLFFQVYSFCMDAAARAISRNSLASSLVIARSVATPQ